MAHKILESTGEKRIESPRHHKRFNKLELKAIAHLKGIGWTNRNIARIVGRTWLSIDQTISRYELTDTDIPLSRIMRIKRKVKKVDKEGFLVISPDLPGGMKIVSTEKERDRILSDLDRKKMAICDHCNIKGNLMYLSGNGRGMCKECYEFNP